MSYTSTDDIAAYLGITISDSSTPSIDTVQSYIDQAESKIELITKAKYNSLTVNNVIVSYDSDTSNPSASSFDSSGIRRIPGNFDLIDLGFNNVWKIENLYFNAAMPFDTPDWVAKTIGVGGQAVLKNGRMQLIDPADSPRRGEYSMKVDVTYGVQDVPMQLKWVCTLMVSLQIMMGQQANHLTSSVGGLKIGDIEIKEPGTFTIGFIKTTQSMLQEELKALGDQNFYLI